MTFVKPLIVAMLYAAFMTSANPVAAGTVDRETLIALKAGDMKKLAVHKSPKPASTVAFETEDGSAMTLQDLNGKVVLLNFWATWCAPCRHEMPWLDTLQSTMGGDDFMVLPVATGRNPLPAIRKFFEKENITALGIYRDPKQQLSRDMSVLGLPVTLILDREGREIARLTGDADWSSPEAMTLLKAVISPKAAKQDY